MFRSAVLATASIGLLLSAAPAVPGALSARADNKQGNVSGPQITPRLREKLSGLDKR